jgi:hypothetical protein
VVAELEDEQGEQIPNGAVVQVNEAFPWNAGAVMWPSMLWNLPELPPELEYHFVRRDLVLVDALGGIVVDVLRDALPVDGLPLSEFDPRSRERLRHLTTLSVGQEANSRLPLWCPGEGHVPTAQEVAPVQCNPSG